MATFYTDEQNEKENEQAQQPLTQTTAAPGSTGGQASAANQGPAGGGAPGARKPTSSGQFVDLGKYYEAGKDNAQKVQQQIAGGLEKKASDARSRFQQGVQGYTQGLQKERLDAGVFQGKGAESVDQGRFRDIFTNKNIGQYTDAGGMQDYRRAGQNIAQTGTAAGRMQALRSMADKGYSAGEGRLDSFLLNRAERDKSVLGDLRNKYATGNIEQQIGAAQQQAKSAREAILGQRADVRRQAQDFIRSQGSALQQAAQASTAQNTAAARERYKQALRAAWDEGLKTKRADLNKDIEIANRDAKRDYDARMAAMTPGVGQTWNFEAMQNMPGRKFYSGDFSLQGPKNFEEALAALSGGAYDINRITGAASLDAGQKQRLDAYNALRGIAGVGNEISLGTSSADRTRAAADALRGLIRYGGMKEETDPSKAVDDEIARNYVATGIAGGQFRRNELGELERIPELSPEEQARYDKGNEIIGGLFNDPRKGG